MAGDVDTEAFFICALGNVLQSAGNGPAAFAAYEEAVKAAAAQGPGARGRPHNAMPRMLPAALGLAGGTAYQLGAVGMARDIFTVGLRLRETLVDVLDASTRVSLAIAQNNAACAHEAMGDSVVARGLFLRAEENLAGARDGQRLLEAVSLNAARCRHKALPLVDSPVLRNMPTA